MAPRFTFRGRLTSNGVSSYSLENGMMESQKRRGEAGGCGILTRTAATYAPLIWVVVNPQFPKPTSNTRKDALLRRNRVRTFINSNKTVPLKDRAKCVITEVRARDTCFRPNSFNKKCKQLMR